MKPEEIKAIWPTAMKARISAKVRLPDTPTCLFGFDTEYLTPEGDYQENVPVCWQWHDGQRGAVMPLHGRKLKLTDLTDSMLLLAQDRDPQARHIVLCAWYSLAEMSVLDLDMAVNLKTHGNGTYGIQWKRTEEVGPRKKKVTYTFTLFDLTAFYGRMPLAAASAHLPQPKLRWNHADTTLHSYREPAFYQYALHDAYLCAQLGKDLHGHFTLAWGASPFELQTAGYMSSALFRAHYVSSDLMQPHPDIRALALRAYRGSGDYGGCYERGVFEGRFSEYDGRSMYPAACAELGVLPTRASWQPWQGGDYPERGIYRAQITWPDGETRRTLLAQVPDAQHGERFDYPQQAVDAWTGFELKAAERAGCKVRIITGWWYERGTDAFSTYLGQLAHKRARLLDPTKTNPPNAGLAAVYKNLGNTIIGKLGQHRAHVVYATCYNPETDRVEYMPDDQVKQGLGGVFAPEWWVLIVGYSRAVMMDVIRERQALHAQVDAVLLPDCGEGFTVRGIEFRRKSSGDRLRLAGRNIWQFEERRGVPWHPDGVPVRFAAGGGGRDLPELRQVMRGWTGQRITHTYRVRDLVKLPEHAIDPQGHPLLSRYTTTGTFKVPALERDA